MPTFGKHLAAKFSVNNAICDSVDESSLLRLDPNDKIEVED